MVRELLGFPAFEQLKILRAVRQTIRRPPRGISELIVPETAEAYDIKGRDSRAGDENYFF